MKILVTGANGQLGKELQTVLEEKFPGQAVYAGSDMLDITDSAAVNAFVTAGDFSHIINCAAYTAVDRAEEESGLCNAVNHEGVKNLAAAAEAIGAKVLHVSTDYVFDGHTYTPYREGDKVNPTSVYGVTKRKAETALMGLAPGSIIVRTAWLYSPHGKNFVKTMLNRASTPEVSVVYDQVGTPTYALDLAQAIAAILGSRQWVPGIYHFSNEGVASWYDFAEAIFRSTGSKTKVIPIPTADYPTPATRPHYAVLDKAKIKATYNITIPHWHESLQHCLRRMDAIK